MILKASFEKLADLCDENVHRYNVAGVRLIRTARGLEASATDGRVLLVLTDPKAVVFADPWPLDASVIIPARDWRQICQLNRGGHVHLFLDVSPELLMVTCTIPQKSGDAAAGPITRKALTLYYPRAEQGRWPDTALVLPSNKPEPIQRLRVDARRTIDLLQALLASDAPEEDSPVVELLIYPDDASGPRPVGVTATRGSGAVAEGVFTVFQERKE